MDTPLGMDARYDEDYFIRGQETGKSLYKNYRWLPELTIPMAERITEHLGIELDDHILDYGCARGYLVRALVELDFENVSGLDVSQWALDNADPKVKKRLRNFWPKCQVDWILAKDVLEHLKESDVYATLDQFAATARKGFFIVVPLATEMKRYVVDEYEQDVTHVIRWTLNDWVDAVMHSLDESWEVSARYRIQGIKDNYAQWPRGNGFLTVRRL